MDTRRFFCATLFFVCVGFVPLSDAIKCYVCLKDRCGDPFNSFNVTLVDCFSGTCGKIKTSKDGHQTVERSCSPMPEDKAYCKSGKKNGVSGTECVCNTDRCNTATVPQPFHFRLWGIFTYSVAAVFTVQPLL